MSCYYPRLSVNYGEDENGKCLVKFLPLRADYSVASLREKYQDKLMLLPCGECLGCKFDKARDWAIRCVLESQQYENNCFVTLTYEDDFLPDSMEENDFNVNRFIKKLRNLGFKFRYFGCSEYGTKTHRLHNHLILFGFKPGDLKLHSRSDNGDFLYYSDLLRSCWPYGFNLVGDLTYESCGYVARYTTKKIGDEDSHLFMSLKPGIGFDYIHKNLDSMFEYGVVYGKFGDKTEAPIPRYFCKYLRTIDHKRYKQLQNKLVKVATDEDINSLINLKFANLEELKKHQAVTLNNKLSRIDRR